MTPWLEYLPTAQPLWPLSLILAVAAVITILTFWTYSVATRKLSGRKRLTLWALRMLALLLALLVLARPTWQVTDIKHLPAKLLILFDTSKSMLVTDAEPGNISRYAAAVADYQAAAGQMEELEKDNLRFVKLSFDARLREFQVDEQPSGDSTALLQALDQALERHRPLDGGQGELLLGMVVYSDGRDNVGKPALDAVVAKLARLPCPVHAIGLGQPGGTDLQPDLIAMEIDAPQVARVKDKLTVRGVIQSQRFENQPVEVWLLINGQPAPQATIGDDGQAGRPTRVIVRPTKAIETIPIEFPPCILPDVPGDYRITLRIQPLPGELTENNNEISTYTTLTKEGLSVLYIDKDRAYESKFLRRALQGDERITLINTYLAEDRGPRAERWCADLAAFIDKSSFDVFIIGDVPAGRFMGHGPGQALLKTIEQKVSAGAGFVMIGGHQSFGSGGWQDSPLAPLIPVDMTAKGQIEGAGGMEKPVRFRPTPQGLSHFSMRLDLEPEKNAEWWSKLEPLLGGNRVGRPTRNATLLAESTDGDALFAVAEFGKGRIAALAIDTTWRWIKPGKPRRPAADPATPQLSEGTEAHLRFWRQLILWLARQEDSGKNLRIELGQRRLAAGKEQPVAVQARLITPGGTKDQIEPIQGATFNVRIVKPNQTEETVDVSPDGDEEAKSRGLFWKTEEPGEYEVIVRGQYQDQELGEARSRFVVYRDDSELTNRSANHALLEQIATGTGGTFRLHGGLTELLDDLLRQSARDQVETLLLPDWRTPNSLLQGAIVALFVLLIAAEWVLRRLWGLV